MSTVEFVQLAAIVAITGMVNFYIGWRTGRGQRTPINTEDIMDYVRDNFGSEYEAYRKGISEGYRQGLSDAELGDGT